MAWVIETDVFFFSAHVPILGVDIWEHVRVDAVDVVRRLLTAVSQAFYLQVSLYERKTKVLSDRVRVASKYHNVKVDVSFRWLAAQRQAMVTHMHRQYLNAIWNVINFKEAEKRLLEATK